ncbi:hypothetical protein [Neolewinella agarilytica]|uniref:hypothetical protein n=1 Tax=Neolewinella agarilytica TaxID=478744 RepID=UPI002356C8A7|nr:hypothetical protein [Neolewinella agarilytica]
MRLFLFSCFSCFFLSCFFSCGPDLPPGEYHIRLQDTTFNQAGGYYQVYWKLRDSASWEQTVSLADTIVEEGGYLKIRSERIWYEFWQDGTGLRAKQPYPGWERAFDSLPPGSNAMLTEDRERVLIDIPSADILLGNDSVRIGIIRVVDRAFNWQQFPLNYPDYLLITLPGQRRFPIALDQDNLGPITRQTVFRVGRNKYALKYFDAEQGEMIITQLERDVDLPLTAELDLTYKQVQVKTLDGEETYLKRSRGKELMIYFCAIGFNHQNQSILKIDSLYKAMPAAERDKIDIAVVSRFNTSESLQQFVDTSGFSLPLYQNTPKTCLRLNCHPALPYYVGIDERGRISTYFGYHRKLVERLMGEKVDPPPSR